MLLKPRRALIVTDVRLVRWALVAALGQAGFVTLAADSAAEALDVMATVTGLDVVVLSLSIGSARVRELVTAVRRDYPDLALLALAADPETAPEDRPQDVPLLEIPFSVDDVVAAADRLVPKTGLESFETPVGPGPLALYENER